jgi:DNA polymerase
MTKVTLDFETPSTVDLKKTGAWKYALHEDTEVLCICYQINNQPGVWTTRGFAFDFDLDTMEVLSDLAKRDDVIFEAHNAAFEYAIWHNVMHLGYGLPDIPPERWRCSASVAAYKSMPRALGDLCKEDALDTEHKKDDEGKFVMYRMCKPVPEKFQHLHGEWYEGEEDWAKLLAYCEDDVRTEYACSVKLGELPPSELELWLLDFKINQTGIKVDTELAAAAIEMRDKIKVRLATNCKKICGLSPGQVGKIKQGITGHGIELPTKKHKKTG